MTVKLMREIVHPFHYNFRIYLHFCASSSIAKSCKLSLTQMSESAKVTSP
jgi:hypothetical protein